MEHSELRQETSCDGILYIESTTKAMKPHATCVGS